MKLGIFLLVLGLLIAGGGAAGWIYADPNLSIWYGVRLSAEDAQVVEAGSMGAMVVGGGLAIDGIIRMVLRR